MKKIFILSAAAFMCIILSACNGGNETDADQTDSTALTSGTVLSETVQQEHTETDHNSDTETAINADTKEVNDESNDRTESIADVDEDESFDSNAEEIIEEDDADDDVSENDVPDADGTPSFGSFEDIDTAALAGAGSTAAVKDSRTYDLFKRLEAADKLYIDAEAAGGSTMASFAVSDGKIYVYSFDGASSREGIAIIRDDRIYVLSPAEEMGIYLPYDEAAAAVYSVKTVFGMNGTDFENADSGITVGKTVIGGTEYWFEYGAESGVLYDKNDKPCVLIFPNYSSEESASMVWVINELSFDKVPKDIFDIPSDYNITSIEDMSVPETE